MGGQSQGKHVEYIPTLYLSRCHSSYIKHEQLATVRAACFYKPNMLTPSGYTLQAVERVTCNSVRAGCRAVRRNVVSDVRGQNL